MQAVSAVGQGNGLQLLDSVTLQLARSCCTASAVVVDEGMTFQTTVIAPPPEVKCYKCSLVVVFRVLFGCDEAHCGACDSVQGFWAKVMVRGEVS
jgi:hypothetical protein